MSFVESPVREFYANIIITEQSESNSTMFKHNTDCAVMVFHMGIVCSRAMIVVSFLLLLWYFFFGFSFSSLFCFFISVELDFQCKRQDNRKVLCKTAMLDFLVECFYIAWFSLQFSTRFPSFFPFISLFFFFIPISCSFFISSILKW